MAMKNFDSEKHVRGESRFLDDIPVPEGTLFAHVCYSRIAHGKNLTLDISAAQQYRGVHAVLTAADIPGENQIGGIVQDEELLASHGVHFIGQPVAVVIAEDPFEARHAAELIKVEAELLPVITDPREAFGKKELIVPPITFELGSVQNAWSECDVIVEGRAESGGQEHLYLETQGALAIPSEGNIRIISSTQSPTAVQRVTAKVLNIPMHKIEVDVGRLGGGFGGKEDQATPWAALAALAAVKLNRPVKLILHRQDDMRMTGKRHPYSSDFKLGLKKDGMIHAYEVSFYQNAGAACDLSPPVLSRSLFHCTNSYFIPNVHAVGYCCRTNLPPNTAFRGFGGPQGMFVIEAAIARAAEVMKIDPFVIQKKNLLKDGDEFPYGQITANTQARASWESLEQKVSIDRIKEETELFNASSVWLKKGFALMPICFGISFTNTMMNQASALVHIYTDGSVGISTAAIEMGQGVNMKILRTAEQVLSIPQEWIKLESTNTTRIANTSPTAASSGADLNGKAAYHACVNLLQRLKPLAAELVNAENHEKISIRNGVVFNAGVATALEWKQLIAAAHQRRIGLSEHYHYATPKIHFDVKKSKGHPFAYHVYGTAVIRATVDCLRGIYEIDSVDVVHDVGVSLHPAIDKSQAEGGIMQGIGWMAMEEVVYSKDGKLLTDALSTYKVPDIHFAPKQMNVHFLENSTNEFGPFNSKAIGEPPFMYGIAAFFAIRNAMRSFCPGTEFTLTAPMTPERVLTALYQKVTLGESSLQ